MCACDALGDDRLEQIDRLRMNGQRNRSIHGIRTRVDRQARACGVLNWTARGPDRDGGVDLDRSSQRGRACRLTTEAGIALVANVGFVSRGVRCGSTQKKGPPRAKQSWIQAGALVRSSTKSIVEDRDSIFNGSEFRGICSTGRNRHSPERVDRYKYS